jgi:cardiolipin synthase
MSDENTPIIASESITLVYSGQDYFNRLDKLISESQSEIHLQTYIFENDTVGNKIAEALKKAAARKVKIYLLLDGFGSKSLPNEFISDLENSGIQLRFFSPLLSSNSFYIGRRLHQKVLVSDAKTVLIGGINIAEKYCGNTTETPWLDYAIQLNSKTIGKQLEELCRKVYFKKAGVINNKITELIYTPEETRVSILQNDWLKRKNEIQKAYIKSISNATKEIIIVGGYFLPGRKLTRTLKNAALNKVTIKLILSGISDIPLLRGASHHFYAKIMPYDIEIYEWTQSVLHGKAAVVDGYWTTIGSFNLNKLSAYGSIEMNVSIESTSFSENYRNHLIQIIAQCQKITPESLLGQKHHLTKYRNRICYWFIRTILLIITYLPYKRFLRPK